MTTAISNATVADDLIDTFDRIVNNGDTMPIEELKNRYAGSKYFTEFNDHEIYKTVIELPLTIDMITGDHRADIAKIVEGLKGIFGDALMFDLSDRAPTLRVRMWHDEAQLRRAWKRFAEHEYKTKVLADAQPKAA